MALWIMSLSCTYPKYAEAPTEIQVLSFAHFTFHDTLSGVVFVWRGRTTWDVFTHNRNTSLLLWFPTVFLPKKNLHDNRWKDSASVLTSEVLHFFKTSEALTTNPLLICHSKTGKHGLNTLRMPLHGKRHVESDESKWKAASGFSLMFTFTKAT